MNGQPAHDNALSSFTSGVAAFGRLTAGEIIAGTVDANNIKTKRLRVNGRKVITRIPTPIKVDSFGSNSGVDSVGASITAPSNLRLGTDSLNTVAGGALALANVSAGTSALAHLLDSADNTSNIGVGYKSGYYLEQGSDNIFVGDHAGASLPGSADTTWNIAIGSHALDTPETGVHGNVAIGFQTMNTGTPTYSVAIGYQTGTHSSAQALVAIGTNACIGVVTTGALGTVAIGSGALQQLTSSPSNVAVGYGALQSLNNDVTGLNTAIGASALGNCTSNFNTALGADSAAQNSTGTDNTYLGAFTGQTIDTGSRNIVIGSRADITAGTDSDSITIGYSATGTNAQTFIGTAGTTTCVIKGISGATAAGGVPVVCAADGTLGTVVSSIRYKEDIVPVEDSRRLLELRPVSFFLKTDRKNRSFGLIAEEVEEVMPELVVYKDEKPETVAYHHVLPFLLDLVQKQEKRIQVLEEKSATVV